MCGIPLTSHASSEAVKFSSEGDLPVTLVYEARASIERGIAFLLSRQMKNGSWLNSAPVTGLACIALNQSRLAQNDTKIKRAIDRGRQFVLRNVRGDGSICEEKSPYVNYSTAVCLSALAVLNNADDKPAMRKARHFLIDSQLGENNPNSPTPKTDPHYGGIGYGSAGPRRPDLSNTQWALEPLYLTDDLDSELEKASETDIKKSRLAWKNAVQFLQSIQNVPKDAGETWIVNTKEDSANDGGFIYKPRDSKATAKMKKAGQTGLRRLISCGSMTYAGLKSMIYAGLGKNDYRVKAARNWIIHNYTLTQNPGMGTDGMYYYLVTFAKANSVYGSNSIVTADGEKHMWRIDLIKQLLRTQRKNGEWFNDNGRWMESVPDLVTSYALISIEIALHKYLNVDFENE